MAQAIGLLVRFVGVMASMLPMDLAAFKAILSAVGIRWVTVGGAKLEVLMGKP